MSMAAIFSYNHSFRLSSGFILDSFYISYECYGRLNAKKDNCILICPALTGDYKVTNDGWWDDIVGPGKAIDTSRFFVVSTTVLGSCRGSLNPASLDPKTGLPYALNFPIVTIDDMVNAQKKLLESFNISSLFGVVGPSMGGMQALSWVTQYPKFIKNCIVIATSSKFSPQALAFSTVARTAVTSDPEWCDGKYLEKNVLPQKGLAIARMLGHVTYLSAFAIDKKFGRKGEPIVPEAFSLDSFFEVERYLSYQGDKFVKNFDANSFLFLSKAMCYFDLEAQYGSLIDAFQEVDSRFLILSISSDWLYPPKENQLIASTLMTLSKEVTYLCIDSDYGHDAFLVEQSKFSDYIDVFLEGAL